jgi:hypothetical protein
LTDAHRPLWALGVIVGTVAANIAMWFLLRRGERTDE